MWRLQVTIFCTGAYFISTTIYKSSGNFTLLNLYLDLGLVISFCVTASVTIICTGISINSCSPGGGQPPPWRSTTAPLAWGILWDDLEQLSDQTADACNSAGHWTGHHHPTSNLQERSIVESECRPHPHLHAGSSSQSGQHRLAHLQHGHLYIIFKSICRHKATESLVSLNLSN